MAATPVAAQHVELGGQGVLIATRADPVPGGGALTEVALVQPVITGFVAFLAGHLSLQGSLNLEGLTVPGGELVPGAFGEGFADRRHPHTYAHELMVMVSGTGPVAGGVRWSLAAGKGFVPYGTSDPMHRPALRYPVNHHWSQVLERWVASIGAAAGPVTLEAALFNGDEPERPGQWPRLAGRFGDSWSLRAHLRPVRGAELQLSRARARSPEHRGGAGSAHFKWSASASFARRVLDGNLTALAEWARNSEADGFFVFHSALVEAEWRRGVHRPYVRLERTERPEDQRTTDLFRSQRPHMEDAIIGTTRWSIATAGYGRTLGGVPVVSLEPVVEVSWLAVRQVGGGLFVPEQIYGGNDGWSFSVALRVTGGTALRRMGRYGVRGTDSVDLESHRH